MSLVGQVVAVTGANGFLGSACCRILTERGAVVRALVRDPSNARHLRSCAHAGVFKFELAGAIDPEALRPPIRAVVHCAYVIDDRGSGDAEYVNVEGTRRLMEQCQRNRIEQFIFVSSTAAHSEARSRYGRSKWLLENEMVLNSASIVKPATIIGTGGIFGRLRSLLRKTPALPVFYASNRIQTVFIDDVCKALEQIVLRNLKGRLIVAEQTGVSLYDFYRGIVALEGKHTLTLPCPGDLALLLVKAAEAVGLRPPISSDNLLSIKYVRHFDTGPSTDLLGLKPRDYWSSLSELARREGRPDGIRSARPNLE